MVTRRDFIKYCSVSTSMAVIPFGIVPAIAKASAVPSNGTAYCFMLNSGDGLLLNAGGFLLLAQDFPGPFDSDGDGLSDQLEVAIGTNPALSDTDGDGLSDGFEVGYDGIPSSYTPGADLNPLDIDTDGDSSNDDVELTYNSDPLSSISTPATGDINSDGVVDAGDVLLANRITLGELNPTAAQFIRGDVAPLVNGVPTPDGIFNVADLVVITRKALGIISF